jgi:hypothetical protein
LFRTVVTGLDTGFINWFEEKGVEGGKKKLKIERGA